MNWEETKRFQRWSEQRCRMVRVLWPASKGTFNDGRNKAKRASLILDARGKKVGMRSRLRVNILADRRLRQRNHPGVKLP